MGVVSHLTKTALLSALASAIRVSELHALSVHPSCAKFFLSGDKVSLKPNPASCRNASLRSLRRFWSYPLFTLHLFASPEDQGLNALCPVRALQAYMTRTSAFRKSSLFQGLTPHKGSPISKQCLSHWLVDAILWLMKQRECSPQGASELIPQGA